MRDITPIGAISIHTPLAGSDEAGAAVLVKADVISIHTPLAGSDLTHTFVPSLWMSFQSTLPLRGATTRPIRKPSETGNFNPHSPCGERQWEALKARLEAQFQSTLPLRGATQHRRPAGRQIPISIHTPLAGSDRRRIHVRRNVTNINPHSPCGERPAGQGMPVATLAFQSTLPLRGATAEMRHF